MGRAGGALLGRVSSAAYWRSSQQAGGLAGSGREALWPELGETGQAQVGGGAVGFILSAVEMTQSRS